MTTSLIQDNIVPNTLFHRKLSAATTNLTNVASKASRVYNLIMQNTSAAKKYVKLYNKATAPDPATDTPVMTYELVAGALVNLDFPYGLKFSNGISYSITGALADTDTTAVVLNDVILTMVHRPLSQ